MIYQQKLRQKVRRNYTNEVNQALSRCFFSVFSKNLGRGVSAIFRWSTMHESAAVGYFNFSCKWYIWRRPFRVFFLKIVIHFRQTWGTPVGGSFPVKLRVVYLLFWWKWVPSWVFFKYFAFSFFFLIFFFLLCERLFWGN